MFVVAVACSFVDMYWNAETREFSVSLARATRYATRQLASDVVAELSAAQPECRFAVMDAATGKHA